MKLKHHLHLVKSLRKCGAVTPLTYAFIIIRYFLHTTIVFVTFFHRCVNRCFREDEIQRFSNYSGRYHSVGKRTLPIPIGSVFVIRFGWSSVHCENSTAYFGFVNSSSSEMQFTGKARENFNTAKFISTNETILVKFKCRQYLTYFASYHFL